MMMMMIFSNDDNDDEKGQSADGTAINQDAYNHRESQFCTALPV